MQKGFAPIIVVILVVLGIGGYLIFQKQINSKLNPAEQNNSELSSPTSTASPTPTSKSVVKVTPKPSSTPTVVYTSKVKLVALSPNSANSGDQVKLSGSGFGGATGKVYFYNQIMGPSTVFADVITQSWSDTEIKINVPPVVGGQTINVEVVHQDGTRSNRLSLQIKAGQPRIDSFSPNNAQPLQEITISGKEFGSGSGAINIYKPGDSENSPVFAKCNITSWGGSSIKCTLPGTVNNGTEYGIQLTTSDDRKSSFKYYHVGN